MSSCRWEITPSWLSESLRSFLYSSSVYSCHLFLMSSAFNFFFFGLLWLILNLKTFCLVTHRLLQLVETLEILWSPSIYFIKMLKLQESKWQYVAYNGRICLLSIQWSFQDTLLSLSSSVTLPLCIFFTFCVFIFRWRNWLELISQMPSLLQELP